MPIRAPRASLPMLETPPPAAVQPRVPGHLGPAIEEFGTEAAVLPRFHVWTLGCQMNQSDSEEMAGALLAAGCVEAPRLEDAELIVEVLDEAYEILRDPQRRTRYRRAIEATHRI